MADSLAGEPLHHGKGFSAAFRGLPAWLLSVIFHAVLLVILGLTLQVAPQGAASEPSRQVGVIIKHHSAEGDYYEAAEQPSHQATPADNSNQVADILKQESPVDVSSALPQGADLIGLGASDAGQTTGAGSFTQGPSQPRAPMGGKAKTSVYGLQGEGYKFAYVFDRSGSMGGSGNSALASAKAELLASLQSLGDTHQFQVIFYNEAPTVMPIAGLTGRLVFATTENKEQAYRFIRGITADGATRHEAALQLALRFSPDVIFFLTDADQPALSPAELLKIRRLNGGRTAINTIEFGLGPAVGRENFLTRLARENGGQYVYIDVSRSGPAR